MKKNPAFGECSKYGEVFGLKNVHIIDAAALPILPEKPHTLTVMANADRIGRFLAKKFKD
jgi:choline dehydrogenase-like flavoprotein